jgi:hypothetical protein
MVVPALMTCLEAPDARVRCAAVQTLGEFRGFARVAEPSLVREESDLDSGIRQAATNALQMIRADFLFEDLAHLGGAKVALNVPRRPRPAGRRRSQGEDRSRG